MENERKFYPSREVAPQSHTICFDKKHFEKTERLIDTDTLVGLLNQWWDKTCVENGLDPREKKLEDIGYYLIELGKNALELENNGIIKVIFEENKITVIVTNSGQGWDGNPNDDILYGTPGHGLSQTKKFADEFVIETNQKKYIKVSKNIKLKEADNPELKEGSRITFIKNLK